MVKIFFLLFFIGTWSWNQPVGLPTVPQTLVPNFQAPAISLPKGTPIAPLCDPSLNVPCLQQWVHQARPMAVTAPGASLPVMKYFLPSLLIRNSLPTDTKMDNDWELFTPSFYGTRRSSSRKRTRYYKKKSDSNKVRRVTVSEDETGKETVEEIVDADAFMVDGDNIENVGSIDAAKKSGESDPSSKKPKAAQEAAEKAKAAQEAAEKAKAAQEAAEKAKAAQEAAEKAKAAQEAAEKAKAAQEAAEKAKAAQEAAEKAKAAQEAAEKAKAAQEAAEKAKAAQEAAEKAKAAQEAAEKAKAVQEAAEKAKAAQEAAEKAKAAQEAAEKTKAAQEAAEKAKAAQEAAEEEEGIPDMEITEDTSAVQAEVKSEKDQPSGCVEVEENSDESTASEAKAICENCYQGNPHLREGIETLKKKGTWGNLVRMLQAVTGGGWGGVSGSSKRISSKLAGSKICSPDITLKKIVKNFNKTCPYKFKDFFKKIYCKACEKQGVPAEIMLSMMTIESAGDCKAKGDGDGSVGPFQINAKVHQCHINYAVNSEENKKCLEDPDKNLEFGIGDVKNKYNAVNSEKSWKAGCSKWSELDSEEKNQCKEENKTKNECEREKRDKWRRAVAAYNGGEGWLDRAVQSMEGDFKNNTAEGRDFYKNTKDLEWGHKGRFAGRARQSKVSWEELRVYLFMERLLPENTRGTGRKTENTLSNLAHVEAVLGRENKEGQISAGIVDYWEEYVKKHGKSLTCSK